MMSSGSAQGETMKCAPRGLQKPQAFQFSAVAFFVMFQMLCSGFTCQKVAPGFYRGKDPKIEDIYRLKKRGFKTILSVRAHMQPKKIMLCQRLGMQFLHIPTGVVKVPGDPEVQTFLRIVQNKKNLPLYIACEGNTDRTSFYVAIYRVVVEHKPYATAEAEFKERGVREWWHTFRAYKKTIHAYADQVALNDQKHTLASGARSKSPITASKSDSAGPAKRTHTTHQTVSRATHGQILHTVSTDHQAVVHTVVH